MESDIEFAIHGVFEVSGQSVTFIQHAGFAIESGRGSDVAVMMNVDEGGPVDSLDVTSGFTCLVDEVPIAINYISI
jgi:fructose-specific phosphotransferase system IIC component